MSKNVFPFLCFTLLLLSSCLLTQKSWPVFFSFQDQIDPNTISQNSDPKAKIAIFDNQIINPIPLPEPNVLGETTEEIGSKRIEVDLTAQRLYAFDGDKLVYNFLISSGKWDRTPTGEFKVWTKIRSQKMSGGSKELGTYYYLPNVPYIMFFYNDKTPKQMGYSLHGTYWHNNFGHPMSHGCINMKTEEVAQLFSWAPNGIPVIIYGKYVYPKELSIKFP